MKKIALLLALLMAFLTFFTACGGETLQEEPADNNQSNKEPSDETDASLTAQSYGLLPGDYYCVSGTTVVSSDPSVVEVIKDNLVRGCKPGTAKLTATDGKTTVEHTVTVVSLENVTLATDYKQVSETELQKNIDDKVVSFLSSYGEYTEVTDRKDVRNGDKVNINYVGKMNGEAFEGGTGSYDLVIGSDAFIDGFEDGLIGKEVGSTVDLDLTFPDPYPNNPDFSGMPVVFSVTINKISSTGELTSELVKKITGYDTVEDFMQYLRVSITADMMFNKMAEGSKVGEIPETLKSHYYDAYVKDLINYLANMGLTIQSKEELLTMMGYKEEDFDKMAWEALDSAMNYDYIFYSYCQQNNLKLSDEQYQKYLADYLHRQGSESEEALLKDYQMTKDALYETFLYEVVMEHIYSEAEFISEGTATE